MATSSSNSPSPVLTISNLISLKRKDIPPIEIPNVDKDFHYIPRHKPFTPIHIGGSGFGLVSTKGNKKFMEDTHRIAVGNSNKSCFFGVYDGHGGVKAADFVAENLHKHVLELIKNCNERVEKEEAIKAAYLRTDTDFLQQGVVSGACCVTALIQDKEMIVSNLGDCRAVLCRGGVAEALTSDHKAGRDDERERIENLGGFVPFYRGAWRVHGTLAVSRSIGDMWLKEWVVAEPETKILELEKDMEFLVLASDGLWDVVSNQEAVDTVLAQRKTPRETGDENFSQGLVNVSPSSKIRRVSLVQSPKLSDCSLETGSPHSKSRKITSLKRKKMKSESSWTKSACKVLVDLAKSRGSMDDITVVIIDLNHYKA